MPAGYVFVCVSLFGGCVCMPRMYPVCLVGMHVCVISDDICMYRLVCLVGVHVCTVLVPAEMNMYAQ